jgi:hypothetical protein
VYRAKVAELGRWKVLCLPTETTALLGCTAAKNSSPDDFRLP